MATISGTSGNDTITPSGVSAGVSGIPTDADDIILGSLGADTVDGGGGFNTLDYSAFATPLTITFTADRAGNITFADGSAQFSNINRVIGGSGDDTLQGFASFAISSAHMVGGPGADMFIGGGSRINNVSYFNSPAAVLVDLAAGTAQDGFGFIDSLVGVRRITASNFNDTLLGGTFGDVFAVPLLGSHTIDGRGAADRGNEVRVNATPAVIIDLGTAPLSGGGFQGSVIKNGGAAIDTLLRITRAVGGAGQDTMLGSPGDDVLEGAQGSDLLIGRSGFDFVGYSSWNVGSAPTGPAVVNLQDRTAIDPWGFTDRLVSIEGVFGTAFGDDLTGIDLGFWIRSFLQGLDGADTLRGVATGWTAADYTGQAAGVTVDLDLGTAQDGRGFTDTLVAINGVRGSAGHDTLGGSSQADWMSGGLGDDRLAGRAGNDRLFGDDGNDVIDAGLGDDSIVGGEGRDTLTGGPGADRFYFRLGDSPRLAPDVITDFDAAEDSIRWLERGDRMLWAGWVPGLFSELQSDADPYADFLLPAYTPLPSGLPGLSGSSRIWAVRHPTDGLWIVVDWDANSRLEHWETAIRVTIGEMLPDDVANSYLVEPDGGPPRYIHDALGAIGRGDGGALDLILGNGSVIAVSGQIASIQDYSFNPFFPTNTIFMSSTTPQSALGGSFDDVFYGGGQPDTMAGGDGNDQYVVRNRETVIFEYNAPGLDTAWYEANDARMFPFVEIGRLVGQANRLTGTSPDSVLGALGNDVMVANQGLFGFEFSDELQGIGSTLLGVGGDDELWGSPYADLLDGGAGDDTIRGQGGADTMDGGPGNDQYVVMDLNARIIEWWGGGVDTAWVAVNGWSMSRHVEIGRLAAPGATLLFGSEDPEDLVANQGEASQLVGNGGNDVLWGSPFNDSLDGGAGDDILRGQGGIDTFIGGAGNDQFVVFHDASQIIEAPNEGYDIVYFDGLYALFIGDNVEEARLFGQGSWLVGNDLANLLVGNSSGLASRIEGGGGDDIIFGTPAGDTFWGGAGNDTIYCLGGADIIFINEAHSGIDLVAGFEQGAARIQFGDPSQVSSMADLALTIANGNTQVTFAGGIILVFGAELTAADFAFGFL